MAFGDFLELGKDAGLAIGNAAKSAGSGLLDYGKSMLSPVTNAWNYANNYGQIKQLRQKGASFANDAHAELSNKYGSGYREVSPWLSQGQKEAVARLGKDAKLISSQEDLDSFKKDSQEIFDDAGKTKQAYGKKLDKIAGKIRNLNANSRDLQNDTKLLKTWEGHMGAVAMKDLAINQLGYDSVGKMKSDMANILGVDVKSIRPETVFNKVFKGDTDKMHEYFEGLRQTSGGQRVVEEYRHTLQPRLNRSIDYNKSIIKEHDKEYKKAKSKHEEDIKSIDQDIKKAKKSKDKDEIKRLKKQKSEAIKTFEGQHLSAKQSQNVYEEARAAGHEKYKKKIDKLVSEQNVTAEKAQAMLKKQGITARGETRKKLAKRFKKAGFEGDDLENKIDDTIRTARANKRFENHTKHKKALMEESKHLKTVEGRKEFVEKNAKATGWEKGAKAAKGGGKLGKLATMAVGGVAVAGALVGLGSVGTARMMMAGGQQPNSNLYNPYQASY